MSGPLACSVAPRPRAAAAPAAVLRCGFHWLAVPLAVACSSPAHPTESAAAAQTAAGVPRQPSAPGAALSAAHPASPEPPAAAPLPAGPPAFSAVEAERVLFPQASAGWSSGECPASAADAERVRCMIALRYREDAAAKELALRLYDTSGDVAGVERELVMDGGFRGKIRIVPELAAGRHLRHLEWVSAAATDHGWFFDALAARAGRPLAYRHRPIAWKFFRSVGRTTPSAYAAGWSIAYNVSGSLHRSADAVRETLFHEIFHLNDGAHRWSRSALGALYDGIVSRCGTKRACLAPYAPTGTTVRGGTYYAFQPDNGDGVNEYAAEIALRYYREHRALLRGEPLKERPFKCGPEENAKSWSLLADEFFGGADLVPPC